MTVGCKGRTTRQKVIVANMNIMPPITTIPIICILTMEEWTCSKTHTLNKFIRLTIISPTIIISLTMQSIKRKSKRNWAVVCTRKLYLHLLAKTLIVTFLILLNQTLKHRQTSKKHTVNMNSLKRSI